MNRTINAGVLMFGTLSMLTGCGSADGTPGSSSTEPASSQATTDTASRGARPVVENETSLNLVARVDVDVDTSVRFYEPEAGDLVALETGKIGNARVMSPADQADPVAFYQRITGEEAPEALRQAAARAQATASVSPTPAQTEARASLIVSETPAAPAVVRQPTTTAVGNGVGQVSQALISDTWFWNNFCYESTETSSSVHHVEWRRATGNQSQQLNDLKHNQAAVEALDGNGITVTFKNRRFYTWSSGTNVSLSPGYYSDYVPVYSNAIATFDVKAEIGNATGDSYDACEWGQVK